tara:strand:+ start:291 stop:848 length:558 start_codon:yes stop_codon:yes gene_type:complete
MDASRSWSNIRRTIQTWVGNSVSFDGVDYPVYHDYAFSDPDAMRSAGADGQPAWVETAFILQGAGRRDDALWQVDVYSRVGGEGEATGDPFGLICEGIAEALLEPFSGVDATGLQKGKKYVNDYADPQNPSPTTMCLFMQNSNGDIGEPDEKRRLAFQDDFRRVTMTIRFKTIQDAAGPEAFYTN